MNKIGNICLVVMILFSVMSCTPTYIGKQLQALKFISIEHSGNIYDASREIIFDYDVFIDHKKSIISVNGTTLIKDDVFNGAWDVDKIDLYFYLLDSNKRILKREHLFVYVNGEFADAKLNFSGDFDYNPDYAYVAHGYEAQVSM